MIWRWSRLINFKLKSISPIALRFDAIKLLKAANYRRFITGITKFKRIKLAQRKRNTSWLPYVSVLKFWIKDYNIFKRISKTQYVNTISNYSYIIYDFLYIKKKNILNETCNRLFLLCSVPKFFLYYFSKKYNHNVFFYCNSFKNNNVTLSFFIDQELTYDDKSFSLVSKNENSIVDIFFDFKKIKLFKFFESFIFFKIWIIYKSFIFFTHVK